MEGIERAHYIHHRQLACWDSPRADTVRMSINGYQKGLGSQENPSGLLHNHTAQLMNPHKGQLEEQCLTRHRVQLQSSHMQQETVPTNLLRHLRLLWSQQELSFEDACYHTAAAAVGKASQQELLPGVFCLPSPSPIGQFAFQEKTVDIQTRALNLL